MSNDLFTATVLESEQPGIVVVTNSIDIDFTFSCFEAFIDEDQQVILQDQNEQEEVLAAVFNYTSALVHDEELLEDAPVVTQVIYAGDHVIIVIELSAETIEYLEETYDDIEDVQETLFGDEDDSDEDEDDDDVEDEDEDDDDVEDDEDDWKM